MKVKALALGLLLSFFSAFFATNAFANPGSGLEIKVSGTAPIVNFTTTKEGERGSVTYKDEYDYAEWMVGFNGRISLGYRWSLIGLYIDQDLGWVKYNNTENKDIDPYFLGGTYFTFRALIPLSALEFDFGLGLGLMYSNGDDARAHTKHMAITTDSDGDASPCFAFKIAIGLSYFITNSIGIGIDLDYAVGMNIVSYHEDGYRVEQTDYIHHFTPGLHLRFVL